MTDCNEEQAHKKCGLLLYWIEQKDLYLNMSRRPGI